MLPQGRHPSRCGHTAHGNGVPAAAWPPPTVVFGVVALCRRAYARRGGWIGLRRPCPRAYLHQRHSHRRDPSLRMRCSSHPSSVLRSPRTPAAQRSFSPWAYASRLSLTWAAQTGLPCSALFLDRVLLPIPRRDSSRVPKLARRASPSPRHDRLGSRIVNLSRLQASLDVAARVLAPSVEAFDTPLGTRKSPPVPGLCYPALRRLPGPDFHRLEKRSEKQRRLLLAKLVSLFRHGAP